MFASDALCFMPLLLLWLLLLFVWLLLFVKLLLLGSFSGTSLQLLYCLCSSYFDVGWLFRSLAVVVVVVVDDDSVLLSRLLNTCSRFDWEREYGVDVGIRFSGSGSEFKERGGELNELGGERRTRGGGGEDFFNWGGEYRIRGGDEFSFRFNWCRVNSV